MEGTMQDYARVGVVTFMAYDLGYIDLQQKTLQPIDNPFGAKV